MLMKIILLLLIQMKILRLSSELLFSDTGPLWPSGLSSYTGIINHAVNTEIVISNTPVRLHSTVIRFLIEISFRYIH